ncbi:hypothetical protein AWC38_SpisGene3468 [Stylophora pistillata]|uniref:Uncharacterized protein n=1 Tax=Stylophora pistillata TaxID=50429 RepID=A0A2B4SS13_STYPI|nr:hypothetical protein AWC38_SpisGene3468 [Stylophora pistillata]
MFSNNMSQIEVLQAGEATFWSKRGRQRRKQLESESRKAKYLVNAKSLDEGTEICTGKNDIPTEGKPASHDKSFKAMSMESLTLRKRERSCSRPSPMNSADFWLRHFDGENSVSWRTFRAAFLEDYGSVIQEFAPNRMHWILTIVHTDIFGAAEDIHKLYYEKFCGKSENPDRIWIKVKEYASERIFREGVIESMFE